MIVFRREQPGIPSDCSQEKTHNAIMDKGSGFQRNCGDVLVVVGGEGVEKQMFNLGKKVK